MSLYSPVHVQRFRELTATFREQSPVGDSPQVYVDRLNQLRGTSLVWPSGLPTGLLDRQQLRTLCRDASVDPLIAYAAVMAWGGRNSASRNYRRSLEDAAVGPLRTIISHLRQSRAGRMHDFAAMQRAAESIPGLGISFYTKLLFFLRPEPDAYILDQFTAKSANLLFPDCQVPLTASGYPDGSTAPAAYEWFCSALEKLGSELRPTAPLSGALIESALFDSRGGSWRAWVRAHFANPASGRASSRRPQEPAVAGDTALHRLGRVIAETHIREATAGLPLPDGMPSLPASVPVRVNCGSRAGVNWQYDIQQKSIHAKIFVPAQMRHRYDALCAALGAADHEFGNGVSGTGHKQGITCAIKCTVPAGAASPESTWPAVASEAVAAMNRLFECVGEFI